MTLNAGRVAQSSRFWRLCGFLGERIAGFERQNSAPAGAGRKPMALNAETKLGPYEILAPLGAGGMGEVYRARDTKLNRDVALKVLPEVFARNAERMARFQREAQVLASLNHPNIAAFTGWKNRVACERSAGSSDCQFARDWLLGQKPCRRL